MLEEKVRQQEIVPTKGGRTWLSLQLGSFEACYDVAKSKGYLVEEHLARGLRFHIPSSSQWAIMVDLGVDPDRLRTSWELVAFNYRPEDNDPRINV
ncbi:hypothetical protein HYS50_01095 [Candidatus Woesearchaeota archaeon]|nr:hypothetical protein [Candidatus Woesearchaeota archaeon]